MGLHPNGSIIFNNGRSYFIFDPNKKELNKENFGFPEEYSNGDFHTSGNIAHFTSWDRENQIRVVTKYDLENGKILDQWKQNKKDGMWLTTVWGWPVEEVLFDSREIIWLGFNTSNTMNAKMKNSDIFINRSTDL